MRATYGEDHAVDYLERFSTLIERGKTVLDVGCGDGLPVDAFLVRQGFAVNGIDASARMIERARINVPEGFYEVKDMFDLQEGEYCVNGVVSLRAMLHAPRQRYRALLKSFVSFMPTGGGILLAMSSNEVVMAHEDVHGPIGSSSQPGPDNTELIEDEGFTIILNEFDVSANEQYQIILAHT